MHAERPNSTSSGGTALNRSEAFTLDSAGVGAETMINLVRFLGGFREGGCTRRTTLKNGFPGRIHFDPPSKRLLIQSDRVLDPEEVLVLSSTSLFSVRDAEGKKVPCLRECFSLVEP